MTDTSSSRLTGGDRQRSSAARSRHDSQSPWLPCVFADITEHGYRGLVKPVRILGGILAAGGGVALVTAMTAMERIGDCGNGYDSPCPPGIENDFFLMAGAVLAIAVGSILTWGAGLAVAVVAAGVAALVYSQTVHCSGCSARRTSTRHRSQWPSWTPS